MTGKTIFEIRTKIGRTKYCDISETLHPIIMLILFGSKLLHPPSFIEFQKKNFFRFTRFFQKDPKMIDTSSVRKNYSPMNYDFECRENKFFPC